MAANEKAVTDQKETSILEQLAHLEAIRRLLECPVCFELPLPPISVCTKGHIVCNNCRVQTDLCPLCRGPYSTARNFLAEEIIENTMFQCKYADQGCPVAVRGLELEDHLKLCDFRPVRCDGCSGRLVNFNAYEDHLLNIHKIDQIIGKWEVNKERSNVIRYSMNVQVNDDDQFDINGFRRQFYLKAENNVNFLLRFFAKDGHMCTWMSFIGPGGSKSKCAMYKTCVECHIDDSTIHAWKGPVNHIGADPIDDIYVQGRGLFIPIRIPLEWHYYIKIWQVNSNFS